MSLDSVIVERKDNAAHAVLWLHGLGADGNDFLPIVDELNTSVPLRYVFPHAPVRPVTINGGAEMRAWYDIDPKLPSSGDQDIRDSVESIEELIGVETKRGISASNIVLAGFSQGGVIALHLALRSSFAFAGVMALSTYLHDRESLANEVSFASVDTPIFMAHGTLDPMIPMGRAIMSRNTLEELNYQVEWHQYEMGHSVCYEEIGDISRFLEKVLTSS